MFENKEKTVKFLIIICALFFVVVSLSDFYSQKSLVRSFLGLFGTVSVFAVLELYLRIQHNIDRKFNIATKRIDDVKNTVALSNKNFDNRIENEIFNLEKNLNESLSEKFSELDVGFVNQFSEKNTELGKKIQEHFLEISENISEDITNQISEESSKIKESMQSQFSYVDEIAKDRFIEISKDVSANLLEIKKIKEGFDILDSGFKDISGKVDSNILKTTQFYWIYIREKRREKLFSMCPDIFNFKSVLYIGAKYNRSDFLEDFQKNGYNITVLEIYKPNVEHLRTLPQINEVIEGDVCNFFTDKKFDVIFWWHGPEHIKEENLAMTLKKLESFANNYVVLGCPWGKAVQGVGSDGNPFEEHVSFFNMGYFERFGYKTDYSGTKGVMGSNIISIKKINDR